MILCDPDMKKLDVNWQYCSVTFCQLKKRMEIPEDTIKEVFGHNFDMSTVMTKITVLHTPTKNINTLEKSLPFY